MRNYLNEQKTIRLFLIFLIFSSLLSLSIGWSIGWGSGLGYCSALGIKLLQKIGVEIDGSMIKDIIKFYYKTGGS